MNEKEWVSYFESVNGRKPNAQEFVTAKAAGEFQSEQIAKETSVEAVDYNKKINYCTNCGEEMNVNAGFCTKCGVSKGKVQKFCENCGKFVTEAQDICTNCGISLHKVMDSQPQTSSIDQTTNSNRHTLYLIAFILNWVALGIAALSTIGVGLIAAAWVVPMTLALRKAEKDGETHVTLGVCTLIFVNPLSGILILVAGGNEPTQN